MGYTPLFDTLTKGTLCGRWPDIGLWPVVLSLADRHGVVDCTPAFIAGVTGLALDDVVACMARFCGPDPYSRSPVSNGARLELLDNHREWGWRIVNFDHYREKSRKAAYDAERTASGQDAARKKSERAARASHDGPTRPDVSRALPLSDSDSDSDSDKYIGRAREPATDGGGHPDQSQAAPSTGCGLTDPELVAAWQAVRSVYPAKAGRMQWGPAEHHWRCRIEDGVAVDELLHGVERYAAFVAGGGVSGPAYVLGPDKFFGDVDKPWAMPWVVTRVVGKRSFAEIHGELLAAGGGTSDVMAEGGEE